MRRREGDAAGERRDHYGKANQHRVPPAYLSGEEARYGECDHGGGLGEDEGDDRLVLFEAEDEFRIFDEVGRQGVVGHIETEDHGEDADAREHRSVTQGLLFGAMRSFLSSVALRLFPRHIAVAQRSVYAGQVQKGVFRERLNIERMVFGREDLLFRIRESGVLHLAVHAFDLCVQPVLFCRDLLFRQHIRFELVLVYGGAEDDHHQDGGRRERRADGVVAVKHHEDVEIEHRHHGQHHGDHIGDCVRHAPEAVGIDIGNERERGASVCRHGGQGDEKTDDERDEIVLSQRREYADAHKSCGGDYGARHDKRFAAAERGVGLV